MVTNTSPYQTSGTFEDIEPIYKDEIEERKDLMLGLKPNSNHSLLMFPFDNANIPLRYSS